METGCYLPDILRDESIQKLLADSFGVFPQALLHAAEGSRHVPDCQPM